MNPPLRLSFVAHNESHDSNADLVVWAPDARSALRQWRDYFDLEARVMPQNLLVADGIPKEGPIDWHRAGGFTSVDLPVA